MKPIQWRHQWDYKRDAEERALTDIRCTDPTLTQQHFAEDADLNTIAKRFGLTGKPMPVTSWDPSHYGDFTDVPDLRTALEQIRTAQQNFENLPPEIRGRFYNDPAKLWDFVHDPSNAEEAIRLGILERAPTPGDGVPPAGARPGGNASSTGTSGLAAVPAIAPQTPAQTSPQTSQSGT